VLCKKETKNKMKNKIILALLILLNSIFSFSQNLNRFMPDVVPPSPTVANQMKFVETPISYFTGTPQISIPIHTVQEGNFSMPVSLDYNAGGIKVSEIASWVGLGWTLSAGGMIGRTVRGLPDEYAGAGFLNSMAPILGDYSNQLNHANGVYENEPDMFYFHFAGHSGRFFFDKSGNIHTVPKTDFKIEKSIQILTFKDSYGSCINKWVITTNDGIKYTFNEYELGISQGKSDIATSNPLASTNSWYLSKIEFPEGGEITFSYTENRVMYDIFSEVNAIFYINGTTGSSPLTPRVAWIGLTTDLKHLNAINFSNGRLKFVKRQRERADLRGDYALEKIVLENTAGTVLNQWVLSHQILEGTSLNSYETISISGNNIVSISELDGNSIPATMKRRLILTGIKELNSAGTAKNNGYSFDYYRTISIPNRFYPRTDHWGYANESEVQSPHNKPQVIIKPGGYQIVDKNPDFDRTKQGTLYKIIHPTMGETHFEYELHTFSNGSMPGIGGGSEAGGLRVKKTTYYDPVSTKSVIKKYYYTLDGDGLECPFSNIIFSSPVYYREYKETKVGLTAQYLIVSSQSAYPMATRQGSYVAYKYVTEEMTDLSGNHLGKSFYEYTMSFDEFTIMGGGPLNLSVDVQYYPSLFPNAFPYTPGNSREWSNGFLVRRRDYAYENNQYKEIYNLQNFWDIEVNTILQGYKVGVSSYEIPNVQPNNVIAALYDISTGTINLSKVIEKEKRGDLWVTKQKEYEYGETKGLPVHIYEILEGDKQQHKYFSYPKDYTNSSGFMYNLKTKNILNKPVETVTAIQSGQSVKITQGTITEYNNEGLPTSIKLLELSTPLDKSQFRFSSKTGVGILPGNGANGAYTPDSGYQERVTMTYDRGRLYRHGANNIFTYYLWGYNRQYPVVQVTSNDSSLDIKSKLTSVELTNVESGNYTTDNVISTLNKILTAYSTNSNVHVEALSYIPFRGVANRVDPKGIATKYEYDTFGRLQYIKDHSNKIVEQYNYNYKN